MTTVKGWRGSATLDGNVLHIHKQIRGDSAVVLSQLTSIEIIRVSLAMRAIRFTVAGGTLATRRAPFGSHRDVVRDPYAITFWNNRRAEFEAFRDEVLAAKTS